MARGKPNQVATIIEVLTAPDGQTAVVERARRFFELTALLQWPRDPRVAGIAARIMQARYVADTFNELDGEGQANYLPTLLRHANPSVIIPELISDEAALAMIELGSSAKQDLIASVVRFLISNHSNDADRRYRPSVKKAFYLLENDALYGQEARSWKGFSEAWAEYKEVGCFLFVRRFSGRGFAAPDPRSPDFLRKVNMILSDPATIRRFFAQSK